MSENDVSQRADDYERKLAEAGSTDGIITALVVGAERSKKVVKYLAISLFLDLLLSLSLGTLAVVAWHNATNVEKATKAACVQSAKNSVVVNSFLVLLIDNAKISTVLTPAERVQRVAGYKSLIVAIPPCYTPPPTPPDSAPLPGSDPSP